MDTSLKAGPAAPIPAAVALLHSLPDFDRCTVTVETSTAIPGHRPQLVRLVLQEYAGNFSHLTPAAARALAVYLVDCANALDNPADRVIVDDTPAWPLNPCQDMGAPRVREPQGGIGHE